MTWLSKRGEQFIKVRHDWHKYSPKQKWNVVLDVGKQFGYMIGVRFLGDGKITWASYIVPMIFIFYTTLAAYTMIFYIIAGRISDGLPCLCISGLYFSVNQLFFSLQFSL